MAEAMGSYKKRKRSDVSYSDEEALHLSQKFADHYKSLKTHVEEVHSALTLLQNAIDVDQRTSGCIKKLMDPLQKTISKLREDVRVSKKIAFPKREDALFETHRQNDNAGPTITTVSDDPFTKEEPLVVVFVEPENADMAHGFPSMACQSHPRFRSLQGKFQHLTTISVVETSEGRSEVKQTVARAELATGKAALVEALDKVNNLMKEMKLYRVATGLPEGWTERDFSKAAKAAFDSKFEVILYYTESAAATPSSTGMTQEGKLLDEEKRADKVKCKEQLEKEEGQVAGTSILGLEENKIVGIYDIDESSSEKEVTEAILRQTGSNAEIMFLKYNPNGRSRNNYAKVCLPKGAAQKLLTQERIKIGPNRCSIQEWTYPVCRRCWRIGHYERSCRGTNRSHLCRRCGESGHSSDECKNAACCAVCRDLGLPTDHFVGTACPPISPRRSQCSRCWHRGHSAMSCAGPDRSKLCRRCGDGGHQVDECVNAARCIICINAGKDGNHIVGRPTNCLANKRS